LNDASVWLGSSAGPTPFLNTFIDEHALSINMKLHVFFAIKDRSYGYYTMRLERHEVVALRQLV
jgi:predicted ferric reductase